MKTLKTIDTAYKAKCEEEKAERLKAKKEKKKEVKKEDKKQVFIFLISFEFYVGSTMCISLSV